MRPENVVLKETYTDFLDEYIDKLTENSKLRDMLKEPINATKVVIINPKQEFKIESIHIPLHYVEES